MKTNCHSSVKTVVITGASSGIGRDLALIYAKTHQVCLLARRKDRLDALQTECRKWGNRILAIPCDIRQKSQVHAAIRQCLQTFSHIDLLIANAGISRHQRISQLDSNDFENIYQTNVLGSIYSLEAVIPHMIQQKSGHIVGISSMATLVSLPTGGAYASSKIALKFFLDSIRWELETHHISVTTICPGFIKTPLTDKNHFRMPFILSSKKGAKIIYQAIQKKKTTFYFPKKLVYLIWLFNALPHWLQKRLLRSNLPS